MKERRTINFKIMKRLRSEYMIGDTWKYVSSNGSTGAVWLADCNEFFETWRWSFCLSDGSGSEFDWTTNKASAVRECSANFRERSRFKRVSKEPDVKPSVARMLNSSNAPDQQKDDSNS